MFDLKFYWLFDDDDDDDENMVLDETVSSWNTPYIQYGWVIGLKVAALEPLIQLLIMVHIWYRHEWWQHW